MDYRRFYTNHPIADDIALLDGSEFLHCTKVTRHKVGFLVIINNGDGWDYLAKIEEIADKYLRARVVERVKNTAEPAVEVVLFLAICKELDFVVRKAVELGATKIVPVKTRYSADAKVNRDRLECIITEAAKQCGRAKLPTLGSQISFLEALNAGKCCDNAVFCYEKSDGKTVADAIKSPAATALFVGSEGGFCQSEAEAALDAGWEVVSLGRRVLRTETAAISALTLALFALGEM